MNDLAVAYWNIGKRDQALQMFEETLRLQKVKLGPEHKDTLVLMNSLAVCYGETGRLDQALPLFEETLKLRKATLGPDHKDTLQSMNNLADALLRQHKYAEAEQLFNDALTAPIQNQAASAGFLRSRGKLRARRGQWQEAAADLSRARDANPDNHELWHELAALLVASGQLDVYREQCRKSAERFGKSSDPNTAERIAKDCLLLPDSGADLQVVSKMADTAVAATNHRDFDWFQLVKGLAEYRQGRFASAVGWMNKTLIGEGKWENRDVQAYMVLAMAHYQLKHTDEARAAFAQAQRSNERSCRSSKAATLAAVGSTGSLLTPSCARPKR